jgi:hypothetical protein
LRQNKKEIAPGVIGDPVKARQGDGPPDLTEKYDDKPNLAQGLRLFQR